MYDCPTSFHHWVLLVMINKFIKGAKVGSSSHIKHTLLVSNVRLVSPLEH